MQGSEEDFAEVDMENSGDGTGPDMSSDGKTFSSFSMSSAPLPRAQENLRVAQMGEVCEIL